MTTYRRSMVSLPLAMALALTATSPATAQGIDGGCGKGVAAGASPERPNKASSESAGAAGRSRSRSGAVPPPAGGEGAAAGGWAGRAKGELGWSAEWRKAKLTAADGERRSRRWREYCCESFCDTAAWLYSVTSSHAEYTLAGRFRIARRRWFESETVAGVSI